MKVIEDPNTRIAKVNRLTNVISVNPEIPKEYLPFIIAHEIGHVVKSTHNEHKADKFAIEKIANTGNKSLKSIAKSLLLLNPENPEHRQRIINGINSIALIDLIENNNQKASKMITNLDNMPRHKYLLMQMLVDFLKKSGIKKVTDLSNEEKVQYMNAFFAQPETAYLLQRTVEDSEDHLLGFGKKAREKRDERRKERDERKEQKREIREEKERARIEQMHAKAQAMANGGSYQSGINKAGDIVNKVGPIAGPAISAVATAFGMPVPPQVASSALTAIGSGMQAIGGGNPPPQPRPLPAITAPAPAPTPASKPKDVNYATKKKESSKAIIFGMIGLAAVAVLFFVFKR